MLHIWVAPQAHPHEPDLEFYLDVLLLLEVEDGPSPSLRFLFE
jgi:hypothetical protein